MGLVQLNKFIEEHPDYTDAYFMRATSDLCILNSREYALILKDIDRAISTHASPTSETIYDKLADHYSLIGKIKLATGQYRTLTPDGLKTLFSPLGNRLPRGVRRFRTDGR